VSSVVLDASAVLALIHREKGHEIVRHHLAGAMISSVNYSEVLKKTIERGGSVNATTYHLENFALNIVSFDAHLAVKTAELWPAGKKLGLSLADRACIALAMEQKAKLLTTDKDWSKTDIDVAWMFIR
jgi:ribonuclease VapC